MVAVTSKTRTLANLTANDATSVEASLLELYNNDATLAAAVTALESGNLTITGLKTFAAAVATQSTLAVTGAATLSSTLGVAGNVTLSAGLIGLKLPLSSKTAGYTALTTDQVINVDATSAAITITLYTAIGNEGRSITIRKTNSSVNLVTIDANGAETINGAATLNIGDQYEAITLYSDGAGWFETSHILGVSEIFLTGGNGHGSTNNKIRRLTTAVKNLGGSTTYADTVAAAASLTVNCTGRYAISYTDASNGGNISSGVSLNSAQLTTSIISITNTDRLGWNYAQDTEAANNTAAVCTAFETNLTAGDIVRPHTDGISTITTNAVSFRMTRIG